jgi:hypothetical protein
MEFVTLDEFLEQDDGDEVPEPEVLPTWDELAALDARLVDLLNLARSYQNGRRRRFCAIHVYVWELKPRLLALVGWDRRAGPDLLRTEAAYDVALKTVYGALPDCRGCACIPRGGAW